MVKKTRKASPRAKAKRKAPRAAPPVSGLTAPAPVIPESLRDKRRLGPGDEIVFGCHPGVPCFNTCCADINIVLTPHDVLGLARRLGMTTTEFIEQHTLKPITKELKLPILLLKMSDGAGRPCPFVGPKGCTVYADRPWACRMYPLAMALPPARAGVEPEPFYFLLEDGFCKGHGSGGRFTVDSWRADQGIAEREAREAGFRALVSHPWFIGGRQLHPAGIDLFFTATYDLDSFRRFVLDTTFRQRFVVSEAELERLRDDDLFLMEFGERWLRFALFREPTFEVRPDAPQPRRKR